MATTEPRRRVLRGLKSAGCLAALLSMGAAHAQQQAWRAEAEVEVTLTESDNAGYTDVQQSRGDTILNVEPRLRMSTRGARVSFDGEVGVNALTYLRDTQSDRVLPQASLALKSMLVDRWIYFDAAAFVDQTASNPYAARPDGASSFNQITTRRVRLSPRVDHWFSPALSLLASSDHAWTRRNGRYSEADPRRDAYEQQQVVRLEHQPLPLGGAVEYLRQDTRYSGDVESVLSLDIVRVIATYAVNPQLVLGAAAGRERSEFSLSEHTDSLYGVRVHWLPTERTDLTASVERRFFGTGWDLQFTHRTPFLAVHFRSFRQPTAQPASQILAPGGGNVSQLLDAILTTRHPDPVTRGELVRTIINELGLPETLTGPVEVFADYAQLHQGSSLSLALLGRRTTIALAIHSQRYRQLTRSGEVFSVDPTFASDNEQIGITLDLTRRLTPQTSATVTLRTSRIEGLAAREGDFTREKSVRVSLHQALSPDTALTVGVRRQLLRSNVSASARETAAFIGVNHRF